MAIEHVIDLRTGAVTERAIPAPTLPQAKVQKLAQLATIRWQHEVGGITFDYNGQPVPIPTDRPERGEAFIAATLAGQDPNYTRKIKVANGVFINANAALIQSVAALIDQHVQACFDNEAALTAQIAAAGSLSALDAIDIGAGWP